MVRKSKKIPFLLSILSTVAVSTDSFSVVSCQEKKQEQHETQIKLFKTHQVVYGHTFEMPFYISQKPISPLSVRLISEETEKIFIDNQQIFVDSTNGKVSFTIDGSVDQTSEYHFGIEFLFIDANGRYQKISDDDLDIYYMHDPVIQEDEVAAPQKSVSQVNNHNFTFRLQFYKKPKNNLAKVRLASNPTGKIILDPTDCPVYQLPGHEIYYFDVPVQLSLGESKTSDHVFSLEIIFLNSFGNEQRTIVEGFNAFFISDIVETIPDEYYNVKLYQDESGVKHKALLGLKPEIGGDEAGRYARMVLPDDVTEIAPGAFIDHNWFRNIDFIQLGQNVHSIGDAAFGGCTHLFEFDISKSIYTNEWLEEPYILFDYFDYEHGFIWLNDEVDINESLAKLQQKGIPSGWTADRESLIFPDWFFEFDEEDPTKLIGMLDDAISFIRYFKIVRIPRKTTIVDVGALDGITSRIFINEDGNEDLRNLLISPKIKELHSLPKGLDGWITFRCQDLTTLEENIGNDLGWYPDGSQTTPRGHPRIDLKWATGLKEIKDFALKRNNFDEFVIPSGVRSMGKQAFADSWISKLVFTYPIQQTSLVTDEHFGEEAFHDVQGGLKVLDLSVYTTIPYWLSQDFHLFGGNSPGYDAVVYVYKNASDADIETWKHDLYEHQWAAIRGVDPSQKDHYWDVVRRPY